MRPNRYSKARYFKQRIFTIIPEMSIRQLSALPTESVCCRRPGEAGGVVIEYCKQQESPPPPPTVY
jgi:hypothetical protein